jgi:hypothetical protein
MPPPGIYVAKHGFTHTPRNGAKVIVYEGDTIEEGHWLLASNPNSFRPLEVKYPAPPKVKPTPTPATPAAKPTA